LITYLVTDCDGVLTDGKYYYFKNGKEFVGYNANDSLAVKIAKKSNIKCIMISSTTQPELHMIRAKELGIPFISSCKAGKVAVIEDLEHKQGIDLDCVAYIGDSVDDMPIFDMVGFSFTPSNSLKIVKLHADYVLEKSSGDGCLLEAVMFLKDRYGKDS